MKRYIAFLALALTVRAQAPIPTLVENLPTLVNRYLLSQSTTKLTVQAPANIGVTMVLETANITCALGSTATESWQGAAATTTAVVPTPGFQITAPSKAVGYTASNVGAGTTGQVFTIPAGITTPFNLTSMQLSASGPVQNYTLTTSNTCLLQITWREQ